MEEKLFFNVLLAHIEPFFKQWMREVRSETEIKKETKEILNPDEAAIFLNISKSTIYSKVSRNELPHYKRNGRLYFTAEDLQKYIKEGYQKTTAELRQQAPDFLIKKKGGKNVR